VKSSNEFKNYETLKFSRRNRILTISLNRPAVLNAANGVMHEELARVFVDAADDEGSDVVVLTGEGKAFSAGGDVEWMQMLIDNPSLQEGPVQKQAKRIISSLLDCEKPVIARVQGDAIGLGATIALFCDIIVAADSARFGDPHVKVGYVAGDGGAVIWPQLIGFARAKEYLLLGKLLSARQAAQIGLINYAVLSSELDGVVDDLADQLASGATTAIRGTKVSINISLKQLVQASIDTSMALEVLSNLTEDHREAVKAFSEKRKPKFTGR
jgi:enoyl-CoA hydratase